MRSHFIVLLLGVGAIIGGVVLTPEWLASIGIMDTSLNSDWSALTRQTALLEVKIGKLGLVLFGCAMIVGALFWPKLEERGVVSRFLALDFNHVPTYEATLERYFDGAFFLIVALIVASFVYLSYGNATFSNSTLRLINQEDGVIEYASAAMLFLASGLALYVGLRTPTRPAVRGFHLFLALLFFVMLGEEISWGQRILGYKTPAAISHINVQKEVNIHNMFGYMFDHLFILCFFIWGCVLPLLYAVSPVARQVLRMIGLPLPSRGLALGMLLITLYQEQIVSIVFNQQLPLLRIAELRELFSAAAFLAMMYQSAVALLPAGENPRKANFSIARNPAE